MDRRSFLRLLGAVGVLTGAPWWLRDPEIAAKLAPNIKLPEDDDVSQWLEPTDLAVYGRQQTFEFYAANSSTDKVAQIDLKRLPEDGGATLLNLRTGPGGIIRWVAAPGEEIAGPVRIAVPEFVQAYVVGTDSMGRTVMASKDGNIPLEALRA